MNRDDIIRLAKEAGAFFDGDNSVYDMPEHCFEKFAALVAAEKDEEIARLQGEIDRMHRDLATIIKGVMRGQPQ